MIIHKWGLTPYKEAMVQMANIHKQASDDGKNHLILTQHNNCFTVGRDTWDNPWSVPVIKTDRGGSITCHTPGQNIYYFCFQTPSPPKFFTKIITIFQSFFNTFDKEIIYQKAQPGFYIKNRKLCSLGFRYKNGISLHGVAINVDVDLLFHKQINPCNLTDISASSLAYEDIHISCEDVNRTIVTKVKKSFHAPL